MLCSVGNGGSLAALSVGSAAYTGQIFGFFSQEHIVFTLAGVAVTRAHILALILITVMTWMNVIGLRRGAILQNVAACAKFAAMAAFVILGLAIGKGYSPHFTTKAWGTTGGLTLGLGPWQLLSAVGVGMIAVFWAYDGWVYITWVAGEVKEPRRNVPLAMVLGVVIVGVIYISMNVVYVYALPGTEVARHETIAHAAAVPLFSPRPTIWLSPIIAVS